MGQEGDEVGREMMKERKKMREKEWKGRTKDKENVGEGIKQDHQSV